uniref:XdhC family protein n=1 Tax=Ignisphaera aggregans TaxID=334771 RepID=A0A7J3QE55_9CREN
MALNDIDFLNFAIEKLKENKRVALLTIIEKQGSAPRDVGTKIILAEDGTKIGTLGGGVFERETISRALEIIKEGKNTVLTFNLGAETQDANAIKIDSLCGGVVKVYINVFHPPLRALVIGLGKVGRPIAQILKYLGYNVIAVDFDQQILDSIDFVDMKIHSSVDEAVKKLKSMVQANDIAIVAHGQIEIDYIFVKELIPIVKYVFLLGSKRKTVEFIKRLIKDGISKELIKERFRAPMGLDIYAETPEEIAISLAAELIFLSRGLAIKSSVKPLNIVPEVIDNV